MNIAFVLDENKVEVFSPGARDALVGVCIEYADGIIEEAKRIEQSDRSRNMQAEVIASHIDEAKKNYRRTPSRKITHIVIDVLVDILALMLGVMFNKNALISSNMYLLIYIILIFITLVLLIIKYSRRA